MKSLIFLIAAMAAFSTGCVGSAVKPVEIKSPNNTTYGKPQTRKKANTSSYQTQGLCNGLPRVTSIKTAPGFCLGVVDEGEGLVKPRYALQIDKKRILVTDMGGWGANAGHIYLLALEEGKWVRSSLLSSANVPAEKKCILDRTHQLILGHDNLIYITSVSCIATLDPTASNLADSLKVQIANLPTDGLHAVKAIAFDDVSNLYMNVGSKTDNCETETSDVCQELEGDQPRGVIRKYARLSGGGYDLNYTIFARGQRNSLGLYWDTKSNTLWTGENARDYIDRVDSRLNGTEKPSDEFNIVRENARLDWPYCYDNGIVSPEFGKADCSALQKPSLLFPAHSAPLSFLMYTGTLFPAWYQNRLLISFHGYDIYGHRIVTYKRNDNHEPTGEPLSLVYGWDATSTHEVGSPVGITQALDGSVLITEDNTQKVLQLYYNAKEGNGAAVAELKVGSGKKDDSVLLKEFLRNQEKRRKVFELKLKQKNVPLFSQIQNKIIDQHCSACHSGLSYPGMQILKFDDIGNYKKLKDQLLSRLKGEGVAQMPPYGLPPESKQALIDLVEKWTAAGSPAP